MSFRFYNCFLLICAVLFTCLQCHNNHEGEYLFRILEKNKTGIDFSNNLENTLELNIFNYMYFYNGGGVGAGDFNNDGRIDLFFTANIGPNKMYLNQGDLQFKDVTQEAGILHAKKKWSNGVSIVDINDDGLLDIYISEVGKTEGIESRNQLYICLEINSMGIPIYSEQATEYGLDQVGFGTQAVFFDHDLDGDLDLFQLNHSVHKNGTFGRKETFEGKIHPLSGDRFFVNENGKYVNRSVEVGIESSVIGYGLGVVVGDVNMDGYPDIYVGNDFHENDYLYINQQDGTFKEGLVDAMMHTSKFSMGVNIGDLNNDLLPDIISLDMLPYDPEILKKSMAEDDPGIFRFKLSYGYFHQYSMNSLQINNGDGTFGDQSIQLGVHATDWSWGPLMADFNLDGYKDLFISNGIPKRMNDMDFIDFAADENVRWRMNTNTPGDRNLNYIDELPEVKIPNKLLINRPNNSFLDAGQKILHNKSSFSNGAITADLDNDGDLDIVVNNINENVFLYENLTIESSSSTEDSSYLKIYLKGPNKNRNAIGTKVLVYNKEGSQLIEKYPVGGFQSSSEAPIVFGVGHIDRVDSVMVIWPDNTRILLYGRFEREIEISYEQGLSKTNYAQIVESDLFYPSFKDITQEVNLLYKHKENSFVEFDREPLIPHSVSTEGPACAVGDLNGDGLDDVFFGSAKRERSIIYFQNTSGQFYISPEQFAITEDSIYEDVYAEIRDYNGDGHMDILVVSGGNEFWGQSPYLQPRLYLSDGKGGMSQKEDAFEGIYTTGTKSASYDIDADGDLDVYVGSRAVPRKYGQEPESFLLKNDGSGKFSRFPKEMMPPKALLGFVTDALWYDYDRDGIEDLLMSKEWGGISVLLNKRNSFEYLQISDTPGFWSKIVPFDYDGDGDDDILALNLGLNSKFSTNEGAYVTMYYADFDKNGHEEQLVTYSVGNREVIFPNKKEIEKQIPSIKKKFLKARDFAKADIDEIFDQEILRNSHKYYMKESRSVIFENQGNNEFIINPLENKAQVSFLKAAVLSDFNKDGKIDLLLAGNYYDNNIQLGRYDASYGHVLINRGGCDFDYFSIKDLPIKDQVRHIIPIDVAARGDCFILAKNNAPAILLEYRLPINTPE